MSTEKVSVPPIAQPPVLGHYRQAVRALGASLHIAGQVPVDHAGATVGIGDPAKQAAQVAANLAGVLAAEGCELADLVALRVYVTDLVAAKAWSELRLELFEVDPPASTLLVVAGLAHPDWLIEVDAVADVPA